VAVPSDEPARNAPVLRHVAVFKWKEDIEPAAVARLAAEIDALPAALPWIRRFHHGADLGLTDSSWDYAVVADMDDDAAYLRYATDPIHQRVIREHLEPLLAARAACQFRLPDEPDGTRAL